MRGNSLPAADRPLVTTDGLYHILPRECKDFLKFFVWEDQSLFLALPMKKMSEKVCLSYEMSASRHWPGSAIFQEIDRPEAAFSGPAV